MAFCCWETDVSLLIMSVPSLNSFLYCFFTHSNFRKAYRIWLAGLKHKADKVLLLKVCLAFESSYSYSQSHVCSFILRSRLEPIDIPKLIQFTLPQFSDFFIHQWPWGCTNEDKCIIQKKREILGIYIYCCCLLFLNVNLWLLSNILRKKVMWINI